MYGINNSSLIRKFSAAAKSYHEEAWIQRGAAERVSQMLPDLDPDAALIEIGCGTGFLTYHLAQRFPQCRITAVDLSEHMLAVAKNTVSEASNISFDI